MLFCLLRIRSESGLSEIIGMYFGVVSYELSLLLEILAQTQREILI